MQPERWSQIDELFHAALERPRGDRTGFLRGAVNGDHELLREVTSLLSAHEDNADFLDAPAHGGASRVLELDTQGDLTDPVGQRLGAYRITRVIDAGGMGAVYLAGRDDDAFQKQVAIKLVRRRLFGSSTARRDELARRFQIERQVLATLDHPYIARLIDGGSTDDGRPYFVMEYVEGLPIDAYAQQHKLSVRERLLLFLKVCQAVQHAHQKLVIHRDLKPGNILVTADGTPKLLDFGLAKLLDAQGAGAVAGGGGGGPHVTATAEFMGTIAYAAPEQISHSSAKPDTRTDVYALGMILYRLLADEHAYDTSGAMSEVIRRITTEPPPPPSRRNALINDELDTIVLKALSKEAERRYQSAGDLHADIGRYLAGQAILAKADSGWYVLRKNMVRHRKLLAAGTIFVTLLSAFAITATILASRLAEERSALARSLRHSNIERGRLMSMSGNLGMAEQLIWPQFIDREDRATRWALWEAYGRQPCIHSAAHSALNVSWIETSDDGRWALLNDVGGGATQLFDFASDATRAIPTPDGRAIHRAFLRPAGRGVIGECADGLLFAWDIDRPADSLRLLHQYRSRELHTIAFTPDNRRFICVGAFGIEERDIETAALVRAISTESMPPVRTMVVAPDGNSLFVARRDGRLELWNLQSGLVEHEWTGSNRGFSVVAVSHDGRYVAVDSNHTHVTVFDLTTRQPAATLRQAKGWITQMDFHPTAVEPYLLAVSSVDKAIRLYEIPSGAVIAEYAGHHSTVNASCFSADGSRLLSAGRDGRLCIWEAQPWRCATNWPGHTGTVFNMRMSPDGTTLAACYGDENPVVRLLDPATGAILQELREHSTHVSSVAFGPDGRFLVSSSYDGLVCIWQLEGGRAIGPPHKLKPGGAHSPNVAQINALALSPDGSRIAAVGDDLRLRIFDASSGHVLSEHAFETYRLPSVDWSRDGRFIALAFMSAEGVMLLDTRDDTLTQISPRDTPTRIVRFSPDGSMLASGGEDGAVRLWPLRDDAPIAAPLVLSGHQQDVFALDFNPDASMIASSGRSGEIRLWDIASGRCLATLPGHDDMVFSLAFIDGGKSLLSAGRDDAIRRWDLSYYDKHIAGNLKYQRGRASR